MTKLINQGSFITYMMFTENKANNIKTGFLVLVLCAPTMMMIHVTTSISKIHDTQR